MTDRIVLDPESGVYHRPANSDLYELKEVSAYGKAGVGPGDRVLDLGAHIGLAGVYFLRAGADEVYCVEPDPLNFEVLQRQATEWPGLGVCQRAVTASGEQYVEFYAMDPARRARTSGGLTAVRGRTKITVPATTIGVLLGAFKPTVIKCDIEGEEYDVLMSTDFPGVRAVVAELHLKREGWREKLPGLLGHMEAVGFSPYGDPWKLIGATSGWSNVVTWIR